MDLFTAIVESIRKRQITLATGLVGGGCRNMDDYNRMVGEHRGLQHVLDEFERIRREEEVREQQDS